jgi:hypothetical protein
VQKERVAFPANTENFKGCGLAQEGLGERAKNPKTGLAKGRSQVYSPISFLKKAVRTVGGRTQAFR